MKKNFLHHFQRTVFSFFLLLLTWQAFAQGGTISGKVVDAQTKEPLPFCNVFINNTTIATTTDLEGNYVLKDVPEGEFELGFSFIGYQAQQKSATIRLGGKLTFDISLQPIEQLLSDVEIKASRDKAWERELKRFSLLFLGNEQEAASSQILNPWVIDFPSDNTLNNFRAAASQPIEIRNDFLGYQLTFDLKEFIYTPQYHVIAGATRFVELEAPDTKTRQLWEKNRLETYLKSPANMFRAMITNRHNEEGFFLYGDKPGGAETRNLRTDIFANELGRSIIPYKPENLVAPGRRPGEFRLLMRGRIEIHYEKGYSTVNTYKDAPYPISWLEVKGGYVYVNANGMVINQKDLVFSGDMDKRKVAFLLPMDYQPSLAAQLQAQQVKDANSMQEKVYLHLDRPYYYQGDQVFFKAYFNYATAAYRKEMSKVLYVELISKDRDVLLQKKFKVENGVSVGGFFLPDSLSQKEYYLRAYTSWNRNYGPDAYFVKALPVLSVFDRVDAPRQPQILGTDIKATFMPSKGTYGKREKVRLEILLKDVQGKAVAANLSASVTDAQYVHPLLGEAGPEEVLQLKAIPASLSTEKFSYPLEREWKVSGRFLNEKGKPAASPFTVYLNNFEGMLELQSDAEGKFVLEDMDYYGPLDFAFVANDKKGKPYGTFELLPRLNPPFVIPAAVQMPKISTGSHPVMQRTLSPEVVLEEVTVKEAEEKSGTRALYGRPDFVVTGESLMRGGNATDLLLSLKPYVPGMVVTSLGQVTLRGGATSVSNSLEPMVMVDGAILPGNSAASNINSINPNDVDRIEVVSRMSSIMGDMGRNGIIAIYLKKGKMPVAPTLSGSPGMSRITIEGYAAPLNFFQFNYDQIEAIPERDERVTLYWNPYLVTDSDKGSLVLEFFTNDSESSKWVVLEGMSIEGKPFRLAFEIPYAEK